MKGVRGNGYTDYYIPEWGHIRMMDLPPGFYETRGEINYPLDRVPDAPVIFDWSKMTAVEFKDISALTVEQVVEVAKLVFPYNIDQVRRISLDNFVWTVTCNGVTIKIHKDLDVTVFYDDEDKYMTPINQYKIQEKFREWGIMPVFEEVEK